MRYLTLVAVILFSLSAKGISIPVAESAKPGNVSFKNISPQLTGSLTYLLSLKPKQIERLTGKKLSFKEKIAFAFTKHKIKKQAAHHPGEIISNDGKTAFILGLIGAAVLLIPFLDLASLPLAILAIVIGNKAKRANPHDRKARAGVTLGIATLAVLIVVGLAVAVVLTIGQFPR
jgi:hypothetical protein